TIAGQGCASQQKRPAHVRFGSKADIASSRSHVRFATESGHRRNMLFRESLNPFSPAAASGIHVRLIACRADAVDSPRCENAPQRLGKSVREHQYFGEVVRTN